MSIDTAFDPTRPMSSSDTAKQPSSSLKEDPVVHLDEPAEEGAPIPNDASQPVEGERGGAGTDASHNLGGNIRSADAGVDDFDFDDIDLGELDVEVIAGQAAAIDGKVRKMI